MSLFVLFGVQVKLFLDFSLNDAVLVIHNFNTAKIKIMHMQVFKNGMFGSSCRVYLSKRY